jgi:hypothetical protein
MLPAVPIDPNPRIRIVAAVVVYAVLDGLLLARRLGRNNADDKSERRTGRRCPDVTAATASRSAATHHGASSTFTDDATSAAFLSTDPRPASFLRFLLRREIARLRLQDGIFRYSPQRGRRN